jgi:hypothetical protein
MFYIKTFINLFEHIAKVAMHFNPNIDENTLICRIAWSTDTLTPRSAMHSGVLFLNDDGDILHCTHNGIQRTTFSRIRHSRTCMIYKDNKLSTLGVNNLPVARYLFVESNTFYIWPSDGILLTPVGSLVIYGKNPTATVKVGVKFWCVDFVRYFIPNTMPHPVLPYHLFSVKDHRIIKPSIVERQIYEDAANISTILLVLRTLYVRFTGYRKLSEQRKKTFGAMKGRSR